MQTPDLTRAQILATVKSVIAVVVAFGVPLQPSQQIALLALAGSLSVVLISADAMIRRARAQHLAGPLADQQAAQAIADATAAAKSRRLTDTLAAEAAAEADAQAANAAAQPSSGIDPAYPVG
jgi:hypothetical protein